MNFRNNLPKLVLPLVVILGNSSNAYSKDGEIRAEWIGDQVLECPESGCDCVSSETVSCEPERREETTHRRLRDRREREEQLPLETRVEVPIAPVYLNPTIPEGIIERLHAAFDRAEAVSDSAYGTLERLGIESASAILEDAILQANRINAEERLNNLRNSDRHLGILGGYTYDSGVSRASLGIAGCYANDVFTFRACLEAAALFSGQDLETSRTQEINTGTGVLDPVNNYQENYILGENRRATLDYFGELGINISRPFMIGDIILMPGGYFGVRAGIEENVTRRIRDSQLLHNGILVGDPHHITDEQSDSMLRVHPIPGISLEACGEAGSWAILCTRARANHNTATNEASFQLGIGGYF